MLTCIPVDKNNIPVDKNNITVLHKIQIPLFLRSLFKKPTIQLLPSSKGLLAFTDCDLAGNEERNSSMKIILPKGDICSYPNAKHYNFRTCL